MSGGGDPQDQPPLEAMYGGLFSEIQLVSVPGVELVGEQHQGRALTSELLRRQATSPGGRSELGRQGGRSRRKERHDLAATTLRVGKPRTEGVLDNFRAPAARRIRLR
jgi:hypothetical protein